MSPVYATLMQIRAWARTELRHEEGWLPPTDGSFVSFAMLTPQARASHYRWIGGGHVVGDASLTRGLDARTGRIIDRT